MTRSPALSLSLSVALSAFGAIAQQQRSVVPKTQATVYRDAQGVPHIVSETEQAAWYALGYEQARDGLLWIQYACKAAKGELYWVRGDRRGLKNDIAVQIFGAHLGALTPTQLRALFSPVSQAITANFYDNCVAFAAGANAYRLEVENAPTDPQNPKRKLKDWLDNNRIGPSGQGDFAWVYEDAIDAVDIVSQGGWTSALWSLFPSEYDVVNSIGASYFDFGDASAAADPGLVVDPLSSATSERLLEQLREHVSQLPGAPSAMSGSNSFAWAGLYCEDASTGETYPGLLADPHQGLPFYGPSFAGTSSLPGQFFFTPNHMWFAHVQVTPSGATEPTLDVFGHFPYAAATSQSGHNRSVAMGGTAGGTNHNDRFVLRLREDPATGDPHSSWEYYSYYHDTAPPTNTTYQPLTAHSIAIKRHDNVVVQVPYWRAQSFGVVLPDLQIAAAYVFNPNNNPAPTLSDVVVYGERVDPTQPAPPWRARMAAHPDNQQRQPLPKMRFWNSAERDGNNMLITSPMIVTLRSPMDSAVAGDPLVQGEDMHWLLLRDFWEMSHADDVFDVIPRTNGAAYPVNICFVDSDGATFSTQLSAIPKRGNDPDLQAAQYSSLDKYLIYSGFAGPVPARHSDDRKFDWRFGNQTPSQRPAPLLYLDYPSGWTLPVPATDPFKPAALQRPNPPGEFPPQSTSGSGWSFKIESGYFTSAVNDQIWGYSRKRDATPWSTSSGYAWVDVNSDNWLLQRAIEAGSVYQTPALWTEAPDRQQIVVERFTRIAQRQFIPTDPQVLPPMTPAEMRAFVVTPRLYHEPTYTPPTGATANASLPTPIRQLKEMMDNQGYQRADRELQFFEDFWTELNNPQSQWNSHTVQPGLQVNLRALWVDGGDPNHPAHMDQVFWYDDPSSVSTLRWIDLPADFPLIDFVWDNSELGDGFTTGDLATAATQVGTQQDLSTLTTLVNNLVTWESGVPAADMYEMRPTSPGACLLEMLRMGYKARGPTYGRKWQRLHRGTPVPTLEWTSWKTLEGLAFPDGQEATLLEGGLNPPYDALYDQSGAVKATLTPQDTNALVEFFLELGGHYINPDHNNDNPSRKLARWQIANGNIGSFKSYLPGSYPLTGGLARITVLRRLLDTYGFLGSSSPTLSQYFRARAYDHNGQQLWPDPAVAPDAACFGGSLRSVVWNEEPPGSAGHVRNRGFQSKFLGMSGSYATLLALFPSQSGVESYFWCTPGVQAMGYDLRGASQTQKRFDLHMDAYSTNVLMPSHFNDFLTNAVTTKVHYY